MLPAAFDYRSPASLDETLSLLAQHGDAAKVMAGGQSLIPLLKLRFARPELVVDIGRLPSMNGIRRENGHIAIGALARHIDIERSQELAGWMPMMREAAHWIADPLVRNRGTLVGSVCHADPSGDWGSVLLALDADLVARSARGQRIIHANEFFRGPFTTALEPDEVVTEARIPVRKGASGGSYLKLERKIGDYATVAVAAQVDLADDGTISKAGVALTSVASSNLKVRDAETALVGHAPSDGLFAAAGEVAAQASEPRDDVRGTARWKRQVVRTFTRRALAAAAAQAQGK
jgi:aerobic carbon-monoxide dehydrogenase medium subunit